MGNKLEWPINKSMIGKSVIFMGFTDQYHRHWKYDVGSVYMIGAWPDDGKIYIGPFDNDGDEVPHENYGFDFELVD